jgi:hypothetical protein
MMTLANFSNLASGRARGSRIKGFVDSKQMEK